MDNGTLESRADSLCIRQKLIRELIDNAEGGEGDIELKKKLEPPSPWLTPNLNIAEVTY